MAVKQVLEVKYIMVEQEAQEVKSRNCILLHTDNMTVCASDSHVLSVRR